MLVRNGVGVDVELTTLLEQDAVVLLTTLLLCAVVDLAMKQAGWFSQDKNGRYFSLHVLVNAYVTAVHLDDVLTTYADPSQAWRSGPVDTKGCVAILGLHVYHILAFQPLDLVDWIHHVVMIVVMLPLAWALRPGALLGHGAFFSSGLPGGIDYLMLVCVKKKWMHRMTEKRWNAHIQLWLRMPGCLFHAVFAWIGRVESQKLLGGTLHPSVPNTSLLPAWADLPAIVVVIATFFWNGPFFLRRVIESTALAEAELRADAKKKSKQAH